eukprot:g21983.t1
MAWYGNCSAQDRKKLQKVVRTAKDHHGSQLGKVANIIKDPPGLLSYWSSATIFICISDKPGSITMKIRGGDGLVVLSPRP